MPLRIPSPMGQPLRSLTAMAESPACLLLRLRARVELPARVLERPEVPSRHAAVLRKAVGKASSRSWMAALMTVWPSWVVASGASGESSNEAAQVGADEAGDLRAAPAIGGRGGPEQPRAYLAVAKALEGVLPAEHGGEQGEVGDGRGVESARGAPVVIAHRAAPGWRSGRRQPAPDRAPSRGGSRAGWTRFSTPAFAASRLQRVRT